MDYKILWNELNSDPDGRDYQNMDDQQVADDLNTIRVAVDKSTITGRELVQMTNASELSALTAAQRDHYWGLANMASIDINVGDGGRGLLLGLFGAGTSTRQNLSDLITQQKTISKARKLGLGEVAVYDVTRARNERGN